MTKKQERYYVVSESELDQLVRMSMLFQEGGQVAEANLDYAEAACRAREVPEWVEYFAGKEDDRDQIVEWGYQRFERIKR